MSYAFAYMLRGGGHPPLFLAIDGARLMTFQSKEPLRSQLTDQEKKVKIFTFLLNKIIKKRYLGRLWTDFQNSGVYLG